jgi:hypothetical protein
VAVIRRPPAPGEPGHIVRWITEQTREQEREAALARVRKSAPVDTTWDKHLAEDGVGHGFFPFEGG